ncbi:MAG: RadC family protein [Candidatus Methanospirareceae archaeon]
MNLPDEELLEFMVGNAIYPLWSKKGEIFLRCSRKGVLTVEKKKEIVQRLNVKTAEECKELREEIKRRVAERKITRPIKEWIEEERPREMLMRQGAENLPLSKLLAIILRTGKEGMSAEELAKILLNRFSSLRAIDSTPISELSKIEGIGYANAVQIKAAMELGKRLFKEQARAKKKLKKTDDVIGYVSEYYGPYLRDNEKEFFNVILLDIKNKPIDNIEISKGSSNATVVDPKEIVKSASLKSASSIILVHNHPSGETTPSREDIELTDRIVDACKLVGVKVLDHIIIGKNFDDFYSFAKEGLIR